MLTACQRNAPIYFEGGKLEQAMIQAERGLEIDPDDYKLNAIRGAILLRASEDNPKLLDQATEQLAEVYDRRSPRRHEPYVLLYYGLAQQKQGLKNLGEAIRLEDRARRLTEKRAEYTAAAPAARGRRSARPPLGPRRSAPHRPQASAADRAAAGRRRRVQDLRRRLPQGVGRRAEVRPRRGRAHPGGGLRSRTVRLPARAAGRGDRGPRALRQLAVRPRPARGHAGAVEPRAGARPEAQQRLLQPRPRAAGAAPGRRRQARLPDVPVDVRPPGRQRAQDLRGAGAPEGRGTR